MEEAYKNLADKYNIPNPLNKDVKKRIKKIKKQLKKQRLNSDYIIKESDWIKEEPLWKRAIGIEGWKSQAPLPATPGVNPQLVTQQTAGQNISSRTGLTATETALLSNEEKAMRLRQRGMA